MSIDIGYLSTQKAAGSTQKIAQSTQKAAESTRKSTESTQKILHYLSENPNASRTELAKQIGISEDGIKKQLAKLKARGFIVRIGPDRGGVWRVIKGI